MGEKKSVVWHVWDTSNHDLWQRHPWWALSLKYSWYWVVLSTHHRDCPFVFFPKTSVSTLTSDLIFKMLNNLAPFPTLLTISNLSVICEVTMPVQRQALHICHSNIDVLSSEQFRGKRDYFVSPYITRHISKWRNKQQARRVLCTERLHIFQCLPGAELFQQVFFLLSSNQPSLCNSECRHMFPLCVPRRGTCNNKASGSPQRYETRTFLNQGRAHLRLHWFFWAGQWDAYCSETKFKSSEDPHLQCIYTLNKRVFRSCVTFKCLTRGPFPHSLQPHGYTPLRILNVKHL